jgi:pimeloyl-ACP methyl ester carboxylesterase
MYYPRALPLRRKVAGLEIEYLEAGRGPPLLYLHTGEGADPDEALIGRLAKDFRVLMPAHPGFGLSETAAHFRTVDDLSYFYLDLMEAFDLRDATVVGSSFGAWLAVELAVKDSSRIARLVLDNPLGLRFRERTDRDFTDIFQVPVREWSKVLLAGAPADGRDWEAEPEDVARRAVRNRESFTRMAWSPFLHSRGLRGRLHRVKPPALVLWGDQDRLATRDYAEGYVAALPDARLQVIPGAGHFAFHDKPELVADAVLAFARQPQHA